MIKNGHTKVYYYLNEGEIIICMKIAWLNEFNKP